MICVTCGEETNSKSSDICSVCRKDLNIFGKNFKSIFHKAVSGNPQAQYELGNIYYVTPGRDPKKNMQWFWKSANQNYVFAQHKLGMEYYYGGSYKENLKVATKWLRKSANQGYGLSKMLLGDCYFEGDGVKQNYEKGLKLYREAAEDTHGMAKHRLGRCYDMGLGVKKDEKEAVKWYRKAVANGLDAYSGSSRTLIPGDSGHLFRSIPAGHSD